jgi:spore germination protein YaaH
LHPTSINQLSPDPGLAAVAAAIRATNPKALVVPAVVDDVLSQQPGGIDQMKQLLRDYHDGSPGSIMKQHVAMLAAAAKPYDGLAIDYEFTFEGFTGDVSVYAQGFDILVRSLRNALRPDQIIAVTAKPRTNPNAASAPARTYDYHQLGLTADLVEVMAYDKAWSSGQPGEIAPTSWVASVANYAHNELAGTGTSTVLLIGNYGYDWPVGISGTSTQPAATLSATRLTTVPGYSPTATSWTYQQDGQRHIVSQITASAMHNEIVTIANPNGQRVGFWSASESDPEGWAKIKAALQ